MTNSSKQTSSVYRLNRFQHWINCHLRAFIFGLGELIRTPIASLLTILVIGIAMAMPSGLFVLLQNVQHINNFWNGTPSISLYLKQDISVNDRENFLNDLRSNQRIASIRYISPTEGLKDFAATTQFGSLLNNLTKNPLPGVVVVVPKSQYQNPIELNVLLQQFKQSAEVDEGQLDMAWVERLYNIVTLGKRITYTMGLLFSIGVLLIVGNTLRLVIQSHREEMQVLKLIGATHGFIRRPLLYRGLLYGLLGGITAIILIILSVKWLQLPAEALAKTYNNLLLFHSLDFQTCFLIIAFCAFLGWIGAWISVRPYLKLV